MCGQVTARGRGKRRLAVGLGRGAERVGGPTGGPEDPGSPRDQEKMKGREHVRDMYSNANRH